MRKHEVLELAQRVARLDAVLLGEMTARVLRDRQRIDLTRASVERHHELRGNTFPTRITRERGFELSHELGVTARGELHVDVLLDRRSAQRSKSGSVRVSPHLTGELLEGVAMPLVEGTPVRRVGIGEPPGGRRRPSFAEAAFEFDRVELVGADVEPIAGCRRHEPLGARRRRVGVERPAELAHVYLQRVRRTLGRVGPQPVDERRRRHVTVGVQEQQGEQLARFCARERDRAVLVLDRQRSEDPEAHSPPPASTEAYSGRIVHPRGRSVHENDGDLPGAVHTEGQDHLEVAGTARAADPRERARKRSGADPRERLVETRDNVGHRHDADVRGRQQARRRGEPGAATTAMAAGSATAHHAPVTPTATAGSRSVHIGLSGVSTSAPAARRCATRSGIGTSSLHATSTVPRPHRSRPRAASAGNGPTTVHALASRPATSVSIIRVLSPSGRGTVRVPASAARACASSDPGRAHGRTSPAPARS